MDIMDRSSIQVRADTRERLKRYKRGGISYDQILMMLMDVVDEKQFDALYERWQAKVSERIGKSSKWRELR